MIWGGAEVVMSAGERLQKQIIIIREVWLHRDHNKSIACRLISNPISGWQVKASSGFPLILHYGELYNYFIIYYNVIIIEIKFKINVMRLNHPQTISATPRPVCGKIVFHETGPWCQKGWGPLLKKHCKLRLGKLHILTWSYHFLFLFFQYGMPVIDLSLSYKFTLFACSVKMNLTPLNIFPLTPDTEDLSVEGSRETLQNKGFISCYCCVHLACSCKCAGLSLAPGSCSAYSFSTAWLLHCMKASSI